MAWNPHFSLTSTHDRSDGAMSTQTSIEWTEMTWNPVV
ncbi:hypothetical protein Q024_06265, partial [Pseudomonas aeruginosa BWHPSA011]